MDPFLQPWTPFWYSRSTAQLRRPSTRAPREIRAAPANISIRSYCFVSREAAGRKERHKTRLTNASEVHERYVEHIWYVEYIVLKPLIIKQIQKHYSFTARAWGTWRHMRRRKVQSSSLEVTIVFSTPRILHLTTLRKSAIYIQHVKFQPPQWAWPAVAQKGWHLLWRPAHAWPQKKEEAWHLRGQWTN